MMYEGNYYMGILVSWWPFLIALVVVLIGVFYKSRNRR
jgi:hypothetical protein